MNCKRKLFYWFFMPVIMLLFYQNVFSQTEDMGLWTGLTFIYDISDKLQLSFEEEVRFHENISKINKFFSQLGLSYDVNNNIKIGFFYRYINKQNPNISYSTRHRFHANIAFETKLGRYTLSSRSRIQTKYIELFTSENGKIPRNYARNKFSVSYNIRNIPLTPYASYEFFYHINNPYRNVINKTWLTAGLRYRLKNRDRLSIFYRLSNDHNIANPLRIHIWGIRFSTLLNK